MDIIDWMGYQTREGIMKMFMKDKYIRCIQCTIFSQCDLMEKWKMI